MKNRYQAIFLSSLGGGLEYYDFVIYAVFVASLGQVFFPTQDPNAQLLAAFAVFAAGYLVRPVGGLIFSHFGDRFGRRVMLRITIGGMAASTICMALLPGYAQWGVLATALFVLLRLVQGLCLGGEIPGAMVLLTEVMPRRRGFVCGCLFGLLNFGLLLAHAIHWAIITYLPAEDVLRYGWRAAFLLGGAFAVIGFVLRARLIESPVFLAMERVVRKIPIATLLSKNWRAVLAGVAITAMGASFVAMIFIYMNGYLTNVIEYAADPVAFAGLVGVSVFTLMPPLVGAAGDRLGLKPAGIFATLVFAAVIVPCYMWILSGQPNILSGIVIATIFGVSAWGIGAPMLTAIFPTDVRYSGVAVSYNLGFALVGGLTPLLATWLIQHYELHLAPAYLLVFFSALAFVAFLSLPRGLTSGSNDAATDSDNPGLV
ncbi:MAG: MFS transporter [Pseudomonadota bacterium]